MSDTNNQSPFYNEEPGNTTDGGKLNNSEAYQQLMNTVDTMLKTWEQNNKITQPVQGELDQFRKSWFYNNWCVRFRQLLAFTPLGSRGVIAIPNTTFEEWLWWFHEWAEAFMEDYNQFKQLVFQAITAIEKHLEIIDKEIENIDKHLAQIDEEIKDIQAHLEKIDEEIKDIYDKLHDQQNQIDKNTHDIIQNNDKNSSEIEALWNSVLQHHIVHSYSILQQGIYKRTDAPGGLGDITVDWWYLNDDYHDMGYQMTVGANWVAWNGKYSDFPILQVDLSQVAPDVSVRPGSLCSGNGSWAYGTTGTMVSMPNGTGYLPTEILKSDGDPNHATLQFTGPLACPDDIKSESGMISLFQGAASAVLVSYLNPNWQPPEHHIPTTPSGSGSSSTTPSGSGSSLTTPSGSGSSSTTPSGSGSSSTTPSGSGSSSTTPTVSGGTTDGKSTATITTPTVSS